MSIEPILNSQSRLPPLQIHALLSEITRRILTVCKPEQIILFGSYARAEANSDSDIDLLVIIKGVTSPRQEANQLRRVLRGLLIPIDVIVATPEQIARYGSTIGWIYQPALQEGILLYEQSAPA
jgi:predicted nucleotidyltransferase